MDFSALGGTGDTGLSIPPPTSDPFGSSGDTTTHMVPAPVVPAGTNAVKPPAAGTGGMGAIARVDANQQFDNLTGSAAGIIGTLGAAPGRIMESPFSLINVATGGSSPRSVPQVPNTNPNAPPGLKNPQFGTQLDSKGLIDQIANNLGQVPVLGNILSAANDVLNTSGQVGPALVNAGDIDRLLRVQDKPDNMPLDQADPLGAAQQLAGPLAGLSLLGHIGKTVTVGDFKTEMKNRGIDPAVVEQARQQYGNNSPQAFQAETSFGNKPSSTNPLVALGQSVALDPTNALFFGGGAALGAGLKTVASGIGLGDKMAELGLAAKAVPDAVTSARGIAEGNAAAVTTQGVGHFILNSLANPDRLIKGYALGSTALSAGLVATDTTADWLSKGPLKGTPLAGPLSDLHDLASSIINNHPLSNGAAWSLFAAFHYPIRDAVSDVTGTVNPAVARVVKGTLGSQVQLQLQRTIPDLMDRLGGEVGFNQLLGHITDKIAADRMGFTGENPRNPLAQQIGNTFDSVAQREAFVHDLVHISRDDMILRGKISADDVVNEFNKTWWGNQGGFETTGVQQVSSALGPAAAIDHWTQTWVPVSQQYGTLAWQRAQAVIGLEETLSQENINAIKPAWKAAADANGGKVPLDVMQRTFQQYPQLVRNVPELAKFGIRDAAKADPSWRGIRDLLTKAYNEAPERNIPTADELTHELGNAERAQPPAPEIPQGPLTDSGVQPPAGFREMSDQYAQDVMGTAPAPAGTTQFAALPGEPAVPPGTEMPPAPAGATETAANLEPHSEAAIPSMADLEPLRAAQDIAQGRDPKVTIPLDKAAAKAVDSTGIDFTGNGRYGVSATQENQTLNEQIHDAFPGYTMKAPPKIATVIRDAEITNPQIATQITRVNALYEWLRNSSPLSPLGNALSFLLDPVANRDLRARQEQELYNYTLPMGAKPAQIQAILGDLRTYMDEHVLKVGTMERPLFGNYTEILPSKIEAAAKAHLDSGVYDAIKNQYGGFSRVLDSAGNRLIRSARDIAATDEGKLGSLASTLDKWYTAVHSAPPAGILHYVRTFYPIFRFIMSPRFWVMNAAEGQFLAQGLYGTGAKEHGPALAAMSHELGSTPQQRFLREASAVQGMVDPNVSPFTAGRNMGAFLHNAFDSTRLESAQHVLDALPYRAPELKALVQRFGPNPGTWAEQLDRMLYNFDTIGPRESVMSEARATLQQADLQQFAPVLQKIWERNEESYNAVRGLFYGNNSRSNLERVLNSYWLYWPLSYQLKAGKWLFDTMTSRAFGNKTNFAGAYTYANLLKTHQQLLATDPQYQDLMKSNPDIFFAAQMLFPITPGDLGVSLNRGVRYAGGALGWWGAYKQASDPLAALGAMAQLGPVYDISLLQKAYNDLNHQYQVTNTYYEKGYGPNGKLKPAAPAQQPTVLNTTLTAP